MRLLSLQAHNFLAGFNPRICKRCDLVIHPQVIVSFGFNPRICKRCDPLIGSRPLVALRFNPRICKRCDFFKVLPMLKRSRFQSTHL